MPNRRRCANSLTKNDISAGLNPIMALKITFKKNYFILEPEAGTDFRQIRSGLARLYYVPGFPEKNRIWLFRDGPENITDQDLESLRDFIQENYPLGAKQNKTAIVIESEFQANMASALKRLLADLPFQIQVFTDIRAAQKWVA